MAQTFNTERAAMILVDAAYTNDERAAEMHDVSRQSVVNYRKRLETDPELVQCFARKKQLREAAWASSVGPTIEAITDYLLRAATKASTRDPDTIHALAGALKILADVKVTKEMLDVRLAQLTGFQGAPIQSVARGAIAEATVVRDAGE